MNLLTVVSIVILSVNLILGVLVFWKNKMAKVNRIFLCFNLGIVFWIGGLHLVAENFLQISYFLPLYGLKMAFAAASLLAFIFFYLSTEMPRKDEDIPYLFKIGVVSIAVFFIYSSLFTDQIVTSIRNISGWKFVADYGHLHGAFGVYFISFMLIGIVNLIRKLRKFKGVEKLQIKYFLIGAILTTVFSTTTNLILPLLTKESAFSKLGPLGTIFLVAFTSYAILKHHLMHVRVIATEIFTVTMALLFLIDLTLSQSLQELIIRSILFILIVVFGIFLIRVTLREIETIRRLSEAKSEFISIASHQLRTPLAAVKGYVSMILEGTYGEINEPVKKILNNVYESNERLINLINDLLGVSRLEAGRMELEPEKLALGKVILNLVDELKISAEKKNIYLRWQLSEKLPEITADQSKIRQIILNILDNAIKYTDRGGVTIKMQIVKSLSLWQKDKIRVIIQDTGEGMAKEEISNIFQIFSRGKAGSRLWTEGTGLGLYVAKKFTEMHQGKIWAESPGKGKGSTFYIELPIK